MSDSIYYNVDNILSHNCLFNFLLGARGIGKTYSSKRRVIKNFIKSGAQFVYLRRYEDELGKDKLDKFFNDIEKEFPDHDLYAKQKTFYMDKYEMGYAIPLSKSLQYKSVPFPKVTLIIFDEFIIDKGMIRYMPNEVETFLELYSTIARDRDVPVLFLSNAITFTNPYFLYFDLSYPNCSSIVKKSMIPGERKDILLEVIPSLEFQAHMSETRLGKLVKGTNWGNYSINNDFLRDNTTFVEPMNTSCYCMFNLKTSAGVFGVYYDSVNGLMYVSEQSDPTCKYTVAVNTDVLSNGSIGQNGIGKSLIATLKDKFMSGDVRFTTQKAKNVAIQIVSFSV